MIIIKLINTKSNLTVSILKVFKSLSIYSNKKDNIYTKNIDFNIRLTKQRKYNLVVTVSEFSNSLTHKLILLIFKKNFLEGPSIFTNLICIK